MIQPAFRLLQHPKSGQNTQNILIILQSCLTNQLFKPSGCFIPLFDRKISAMFIVFTFDHHDKTKSPIQIIFHKIGCH